VALLIREMPKIQSLGAWLFREMSALIPYWDPSPRRFLVVLSAALRGGSKLLPRGIPRMMISAPMVRYALPPSREICSGESDADSGVEL
jgi:hypothetical protein